MHERIFYFYKQLNLHFFRLTGEGFFKDFKLYYNSNILFNLQGPIIFYKKINNYSNLSYLNVIFFIQIQEAIQIISKCVHHSAYELFFINLICCVLL